MFFVAKYNQYLNTLMILIMMMLEVPIIGGLCETATIPSNNLKNQSNYWPIPEGVSGDLYNIFKERLQGIQQELSYHKLNDDQKKIDYEVTPEDDIQIRLISRFARGNGNGSGKHPEGRQGYFYNYGKESTNNNDQSNFSGREVLPGNILTELNSIENNESNEILFNNDNTNSQRRREAGNHSRTCDNSTLYPSILSKALEYSLNPATNTKSSGNFLANVARQMNTTAIGLAKELTKPSHVTLNDNINLNQIFRNYASNIGYRNQIASTHNMLTPDTLSYVYPALPAQSDKEQLKRITTPDVGEILDKVLYKLEQIHKDRYEDQDELPDGIPCDIVGTWSSSAIGLYFDIQKLSQDKIHVVAPSLELNNIILAIEVRDCTPPKRHHFIVDLDWIFGGIAVKQIGGPFYMYAQKRSESLVGTFLGFCRTCRGIDTIFGSWSFLSPSKNCLDISMAFDVKKDLLHRVHMKSKHKERLKDPLH